MQTPAKQAIADGLIAKEQFLDAAEVMRADIRDPDYIQLIRATFRDPAFVPSPVHEEVRNLDLKIVVTTNYDSIYEDFCNAGGAGPLYNKCTYYEDHLVNDVKSDRRLVIKAHGCVSDPTKTVLTRSQYFKARKDNSRFYRVLDALFITNTLLFIGYSLGDPDVRLVLENVNITAQSSCPHYAIVSEGNDLTLKAALRTSYNVDYLEHTAGQYDEIVTALKALNNDVAIYRSTHP